MSSQPNLPWYNNDKKSKDDSWGVDEQSFSMMDLYEVSQRWPNRWERYESYGILGAVGLSSSLSAVILNEQIRRAYLMGRLMRGFTTFFNVVFPATLSMATSSTLVVKPVLSDRPYCSVCIGLRQSAINIGTGVVYPLIYNQLIYLASIHYSHLYHLPAINTEPKAFWQFLKSKLMGLRWTLTLLVVAHIIVAPLCVGLAERKVVRMHLALEENLVEPLPPEPIRVGKWEKLKSYVKSKLS